MSGIDHLFEQPNALGIKCKKCGSTSMNLQNKGSHVGLYCDECECWQKWLKTSDQHKFLKGDME